jgi:hypothetical protein
VPWDLEVQMHPDVEDRDGGVHQLAVEQPETQRRVV